MFGKVRLVQARLGLVRSFFDINSLYEEWLKIIQHWIETDL